MLVLVPCPKPHPLQCLSLLRGDVLTAWCRLWSRELGVGMPGRCLVSLWLFPPCRAGAAVRLTPQHLETPDLELEGKAGCLMLPLLFSISLGLRPISLKGASQQGSLP